MGDRCWGLDGILAAWVGTTWNDLKESSVNVRRGDVRTQGIAHRIFRQIIRGCSIVYTREVLLLRRIGELVWTVGLGLAQGGIGIAVAKREWRGGGRVGRRG